MRASIVVILLCAGCQKTAPPPATTSPPSAADRALSDLLRRADAVTRKETPAAAPLPVPGPVNPAPVVMPNSGPRPSAYAPYYPQQSRRSPMSTETVKTDLEKMQDRARATFAYRIGYLAQAQTSLNGLRARKAIACTGTSTATVTGAYRPNTALNPNVPGAPNVYPPAAGALQVENANSPECRSLTAALTSQEMTFRAGMDQIDSDARKMGIYPGVMRDLYTAAGISM